MLLILPLVGIDTFTPVEPPQTVVPELRLALRGTDATGYESAEGFVVMSGSYVAASEVPSVHDYIKKLRAKLVTSGVLIRDGARLRFTQDYAFNSPPTASGVVLGRSSNGRADWKTTDGRTLAQLQAATAKAVS